MVIKVCSALIAGAAVLRSLTHHHVANLAIIITKIVGTVLAITENTRAVLQISRAIFYNFKDCRAPMRNGEKRERQSNYESTLNPIFFYWISRF